MPIKHNFVSPIADEGNPGEVGPDEWNDSHTLPAHGELSGLLADDHPQYALDFHSFVTMAPEARLPDARVLMGSATVNIADGGAGAAVTLSVLPGGIDHNSLLNLTVGDPHTQYTRKDVLTTTGDLYYASAASTPNRLALAAPAVSVRNVLGVDNGDTIPSWKTALDSTAPTTIAASDAAAAGTSLIFAHRDHRHGAPANFPGTPHALLDGSVNNDTVAHAPVRGDLIAGNATPAWARFAIGAAGSVLWTAGTDPAWTVNPTIAGYGRFGSASAPNNTTAGDLTALRAILGTDVSLGGSTAGGTSYAGARLAVSVPTHIPPASADDAFMTVVTYADDGTGGSNARSGLYFENYVAPTAATLGDYRGIEGNVFHDVGAFQVTTMRGSIINLRHSVAATVVNMLGSQVALILSTSTSANVTTAVGFRSGLTGSGGGTITTLSHFLVVVSSLPAAITTHVGLNIPNLGGAGVATAVGVDIAAQSGATANFDIRGAANSVFGGYVRVGAVTAPTNVTAGDLTAVRVLAGDAALATGVVLAAAGAATVTTWERVGSASAPTNTTAGDLTAVRLLAGDAALASGVVLAAAGNGSVTGWARVGSASAPTNTTAGDLTAVRVLAGDATLAASVVLAAAGNATVTGYLRVGGATAPTNTTAGDLTAIRIDIGTQAFASFNAASMLLVPSAMTNTTGGNNTIWVQQDFAPTAASSAQFNVLNLNAYLTMTNGALTGTAAIFNTTINHRSDQAISDMRAWSLSPLMLISGSPATGGVITALRGMIVRGWVGFAAKAITVTTGYALDLQPGPESAGSSFTATTIVGLNVQNAASGGTITNQIQIDIAKPTQGATLNFGIRNAGNSVQTGYARIGAVTVPANVTDGDLSSVRAVHGTDAAIPTGVVLFLNQGTLGNEVFRITSVATNDDPTESVYQNRVATTDATQTTLHTVTIPTATTVFISATVIARRTGGTLGTAEDGAAYVVEAAVKNVAGVATLIGAVLSLSTMEDQALWDATVTVTGATALLRVTGALSNNVTWHCSIRVWSVGT